jgi:hypothetical protein
LIVRDSTVTESELRVDVNNGVTTGGTITVDSFGNVGQPITGSYNVKLCTTVTNTSCASPVKNYSGNYRVVRTVNYGSLGFPIPMASYALSKGATLSKTDGIAPANGKNYYSVLFAAAGTAYIALSPNANSAALKVSPTVNVNIAVYTDAGLDIRGLYHRSCRQPTPLHQRRPSDNRHGF